MSVEKNEPPILWHNLAISHNLLYLTLSVAFVPVSAMTYALIALDFAWDSCTVEQCTSMQRVSSVWCAGGILYVLVEEIWKSTPRVLLNEIELSLELVNDNLRGAVDTKAKHRKFANRVIAIEKPVVRTIEAILLIGGALLSGFGDLLARFA